MLNWCYAIWTSVISIQVDNCGCIYLMQQTCMLHCIFATHMNLSLSIIITLICDHVWWSCHCLTSLEDPFRPMHRVSVDPGPCPRRLSGLPSNCRCMSMHQQYYYSTAIASYRWKCGGFIIFQYVAWIVMQLRLWAPQNPKRYRVFSLLHTHIYVPAIYIYIIYIYRL